MEETLGGIILVSNSTIALMCKIIYSTEPNQPFTNLVLTINRRWVVFL